MSDLVSGLAPPSAPSALLSRTSESIGIAPPAAPAPTPVVASSAPSAGGGGDFVTLRDKGGEYRVPRAQYDQMQAGGYRLPGAPERGNGPPVPLPPGAGSDPPSPDHPVSGGVPMTPYGSETAHRFINWIGKNEGADWGTLYGNAVGWGGRLTTEGVPIVNGVPWQGGRGPDGRPTHAFGKGQFQPATWKNAVAQINRAEPNAPIDVTDASPLNQSRVEMHLAHARDPHFLDKFAAGDYRGLSATLSDEWTSLKKYGSSGEGSGSSGPPNLQNIAMGPFNEGSSPMIQQWSAERASAYQDFKTAKGESDSLRSAAHSALARWDAERDKPPQNMHELWGQWSGVAGALALLGGVFGHNHTAALAAAGTMLQAANAGDDKNFERSYKQWSDHLDRGQKLIDMLLSESHSILDDAHKSYQDKLHELSTLSTAYHLEQELNPNSVPNLMKQADLTGKLTQIAKANIDQEMLARQDSEIKASADSKDAAWLREHPEAGGKLPPEIHNQHLGSAEQERRGTSSAQQTMQWRIQQADAEIANGAPKDETYQKWGVTPKGKAAGPGTSEQQIIASHIKAREEELGRPLTAAERETATLEGRRKSAQSAQEGRVAGGKVETAADKQFAHRKASSDAMIAAGLPKEEADRRSGLIPKLPPSGAYTERGFIQGMVESAEQKAASESKRFTKDDRNQVTAEAHAEWLRQAASGRAAGTPDKSGQKGWMILTEPNKKDENGNPLAFRYNPNTNQATTPNGEPYQPEGFQRVGTTTQGPVDHQQVDYVAKGIAEYRIAPLSGWAMNKPFGQAVMSRVVEMNPEYNASEYRARYIGETRFTTGKQGDTIRSFGTSIDHLDTMQEAADALANGNMQALNAAKNKIKAQFGYEGPVDFNFVRSIVGAEVSKAIIGGVGALRDRDELREGFDLMNSPAQSAGVIRMAKKLMAGQLKNLRQQASSIGWDDERFNHQISPIARRELEELGRGRETGAAVAPPPLVSSQSDYDALPAKAKFRDAAGNIREKP